MINYYIPDFFFHYNVNLKLLELVNNEKDIFYDDFKIGAVFGNFPNCIWNGGGNFIGRNVDKSEMIKISNIYNSYGVPVRLTMTNPLIEERDLYDRYSNYIMKNLNNGFNQVLISSPVLEEYVRKEYPEYPIVRSILAAENVYYDDSDKYFMSVLRKHKNTDFELLNNIKNKEKIEILVNETCDENCKFVYDHYLQFAKKTLHKDEEVEYYNCVHANTVYKYKFNRFKNLLLTIPREKIKEVYEPLGFTNFKISGRGCGNNIPILFYAHYMVKPEYQFDFISIMMDEYVKDCM